MLPACRFSFLQLPRPLFFTLREDLEAGLCLCGSFLKPRVFFRLSLQVTLQHAHLACHCLHLGRDFLLPGSYLLALPSPFFLYLLALPGPFVLYLLALPSPFILYSRKP